jgi:hypothetical protein
MQQAGRLFFWGKAEVENKQSARLAGVIFNY